MTAGLLSLPINSWRASLNDLPGRFGRWWLREVLDLFPGRVAQWLRRGGRKVLMLQAVEGAVRLDLLSDRRERLASERIGSADYSAASIDHLLKACGLARKDVVIGVRLPAALFFGRRLVLPTATSHM